jgi:hypothetical protein
MRALAQIAEQLSPELWRHGSFQLSVVMRDVSDGVLPALGFLTKE